MRFIDLFAGVGGFHLGLERANNIEKEQRYSERKESNNRTQENSSITRNVSAQALRCVWANEWNKYAGEVYQKRFSNTPFFGEDIREIKANEIPDHDLLCGGFPCQAFSVAGKRRGFEETRGTLFFEIARIAQEKRPRLLLLENVKGLLSHDKGRTYATILNALDEIGYDVERELLNSKNFGVPQNRERVFIIGHLREKRGKQIFPLGENGEKIEGKEHKQRLGETANTLKARDYANWGGNFVPEIAGSLTGGGHSGGLHSDMTAICVSPPHGFYKGGQKEYPNLKANAFSSYNELVKSKTRVRRLTPIECERLQGFPDNWTEGLSDTQRYKCMGNAVTVNVVQAIGEKILSLWRKSGDD